MNNSSRGRIKCLVWDLDNTLWRGVLSEGDSVSVLPQIRHLIATLDQRGILQSIASKNDAVPALALLREFGLAEYFLYPEINWGAKSQSIKRIAERINIGIDSIAFVDDQAFERDEVAFALRNVFCIDMADIETIADMEEFNPRFLTDESGTRRQMYLLDSERCKAEENFAGPQEEFLASLKMIFTISRAALNDLERLEELTARTNQLNTTGYIYSYEELDFFRTSETHLLLVAALDDKYGAYGKIGLTLIEKNGRDWKIKLMLMSCRVMSRGVGTVLLNHVMRLARAAGVTLRAEMIPNERNRMMLLTYKFAGFTPIEKVETMEVFEHTLHTIPAIPGYIELVSEA